MPSTPCDLPKVDMPKFLSLISDDDDEVIILPYVKPTPPIICISGSEDECETKKDSQPHRSSANKTKERGSISKKRVEQNDPSPQKTKRTRESVESKRANRSKKQKQAPDSDARNNLTNRRKHDRRTSGSGTDKSSNVDPERSNGATSSTVTPTNTRTTVSDDPNVPNFRIDTNIFHPSESAILDSTNETSSSTSPNPTPNSENSASKKKRNRQSTLVRQQFEIFLRGINLPPPPPTEAVGRCKSKSAVALENGEPDIGTPSQQVLDGVDLALTAPSDSVTNNQASDEMFVSVTTETSGTDRRRRSHRSSRSSSMADIFGTEPPQENDSGLVGTIPVNIQYNLLFKPPDLQKASLKVNKSTKSGKKEKHKASNSTTKSKAKGNESGKKRKLSCGGENPSTPKNPRQEETTRKRLSRSEKLEKNSTPSNESNGIKIVASATASEIAGFPAKWDEEMRSFYGTLMEEDFEVEKILSLQPDNQRHWRTSVDKNPMTKPRKEPCDLCNSRNHRTGGCPRKGKLTKCIFCADVYHAKNDCPVKICLFCGSSTSRIEKYCSQCLRRKPKPYQCELCGVRGHSKKTCPDNWRRYHSTTNDLRTFEEIIAKLKSRHRLLTATLTKLPKSRNRVKQMKRSITELEKEIHRTRVKLVAVRRAQTMPSEGHEYKPRYKQYCSNCAGLGHNCHNCRTSRDGNCVVPYPNKLYVMKELKDVKHSSQEKHSPSKKRKNPPSATATSSTETSTCNPLEADASNFSFASKSAHEVIENFENETPEVQIATITSAQEEEASRRIPVDPSSTDIILVTIDTEPQSTPQGRNYSEVTTTGLVPGTEEHNSQSGIAKTIEDIVCENTKEVKNVGESDLRLEKMKNKPILFHDVVNPTFDVDERCLPSGQTLPAIPFKISPEDKSAGLPSSITFGPSMTWEAAIELFQRFPTPSSYPQGPGIVHVPVPIPVPMEEYEKIFNQNGSNTFRCLSTQSKPQADNEPSQVVLLNPQDSQKLIFPELEISEILPPVKAKSQIVKNDNSSSQRISEFHIGSRSALLETLSSQYQKERSSALPSSTRNNRYPTRYDNSRDYDYHQHHQRPSSHNPSGYGRGAYQVPYGNDRQQNYGSGYYERRQPRYNRNQTDVDWISQREYNEEYMRRSHRPRYFEYESK